MTAKTAKTKSPRKQTAKSPVARRVKKKLVVAEKLVRVKKVRAGEPKINKSAALRELIQRPEGATIDEMMNATGWQKHTVRAWLSRGGGSLKAPGPKVVRDAETGRYRQPVE